MANTRNFNRSFAGGEISPEMFGRIDADRYQAGASKLVNMLVKPQGPAKNRPGFQYINTTKNPTVASRLIRFRYSVTDSFIVEIGDLYMRFHKNGGTIGAGSPPALKRGACTITNTNANISYPSHPFGVGEQVSFSATVGTNITAGTIYYIKSITANNFQVSLTDGGVAVTPNGSGSPIIGKVYYLSDLVTASLFNFYAKGQVFSATSAPVTAPSPISNSSWHYMPSGIYEIPSPYPASVIFDLTYSQSNDVMTFAHPDYGVKELRRYNDTDWEIVGASFDATCFPPTIVGYGKKGSRIAIDFTREFDEPGTNNALVSFSFSAPQISVGDKISFSGTNTTYLDDELFLVNEVNAGGKWISYNKFETGTLLTRNMTIKFNTDTISVHNGSAPWTAIPHGLKENAAIYFPAGGSIPATLSVGTVYYVTSVTDTTFRIKSSISSPTPLSFASVIPNATTYHRVVGGFYQPLSETLGFDNSYKVTSIHEDTTESAASNPIPIKNNIYAATAFNVIAWDRVSNAAKYKVYKQQAGLYGYIGELEQISDYQYTGVYASVTTTAQTVFTIPSGHDLVDNAPVKLYQNISGTALPSGLVEGRVYFVKRIDEGVDSGGFYLLSDINGSPISASAVSTGPYKLVRMQFFIDDNIAPDMGITPPIRNTDDLNSVYNYPRAVGHFEQRRCFGGTYNDPQSLWMSRSGTENDFSYSIPVKDDDRVEFEVAARELNTIRHIVPMQNLVLLTGTAEWRVTSVNSDAITPNSVSVRPQSYIGANEVQPEIVNNSLVFCAARGGHVRELGYNWQAQSFVTGDLSLRAAHLFDNYELTDMTYGKSPIPCLWFVSTSGKLLGLTYVPEEQVAAWHQHETDGEFVSCATIPEQEEDRLYVVVKRNLGGVDKHCIERMATIEVDSDIKNAFYVDCGVTKNPGTLFTVFDGLAHLEGETVSVLADGVPYTKTVTGNQIVLDTPVTIAHAGLPYVSDLQTLPVTLQVDGFGQGRNYNVNKAWVRVFQTAGVKVGPSSDKLVAANPYVTTPQLQESTIQVLVTPSWQADGQVYIRQTEPLPMTVVGLTFEVSVGG